ALGQIGTMSLYGFASRVAACWCNPSNYVLLVVLWLGRFESARHGPQLSRVRVQLDRTGFLVPRDSSRSSRAPANRSSLSIPLHAGPTDQGWPAHLAALRCRDARHLQ